MPGHGVFPGTFNPVTVAHLAIAEAAVHQCHLDRLDVALSEAPLAKHGLSDLAPLDQRVEEVRAALSGWTWARVVVVSAQLVADIARGYDVVVLGADKWDQVRDPAWYGGDTTARDLALANLPAVAIAPRAGWPEPGAQRLEVPEWVGVVSATAVRAGRTEWHGLSAASPTA
jgi:hypothetical protein